MTKYIAVSATSKTVVENWGGTSRFTDDALTQLAETVSDKLVLFDFNPEKPIGKIVSGKNDNGKLTIIAEIDYDFDVKDTYRLVPGFIVNQDEWDDESEKEIHRTIKNVESMAYGLTEKPAEQGLPKIERID